MNAKRRRLAEDLFRKLREMSFDGVGISRETYGPGETAAMRLIEQLATRHGIADKMGCCPQSRRHAAGS